MEIEVPLGGCTHCIQVLKPVSAKDALYVEFADNPISVVINFLRESGFEPDNVTKKIKHDGDKGIPRRIGGKFLVKNGKGKHKSKIVSTLWDAIALQTNHSGDETWAEDPTMAMKDAATGYDNAVNEDCYGDGAEDPSLNTENAVNEDDNEAGIVDPLMGVIGLNRFPLPLLPTMAGIDRSE